MKPKINIDKAEEMVLSYMERIEEIEEKISASFTLLGEGALDRAKTIDRNKERRRLAGIPEPAFLIGEKEDPIAMYLSDVFTVTANLAGIPAISIPVSLSQ